MALLGNRHLQMRYWRTVSAMDHLVRNADGDELLFVHAGNGEFFCDYGHLSYRQRRLPACSRGARCGDSNRSRITDLLMIEATGGNYRLPDRGMLGRHSIFDPGVLDRPASRRSLSCAARGRTLGSGRQARRDGSATSPIRSIRSMRWDGRATCTRYAQHGGHPAGRQRAPAPPAVGAQHVREPAFRRLLRSCRVRSRPTLERSSCRSSTATTTTTR